VHLVQVDDIDAQALERSLTELMEASA